MTLDSDRRRRRPGRARLPRPRRDRREGGCAHRRGEPRAARGVIAFGEAFVCRLPGLDVAHEPVARRPLVRAAARPGGGRARVRPRSGSVPPHAAPALYVAIGIDERDPHGSTIYNSLLYLGPTATCSACTASSCRPGANASSGAMATVPVSGCTTRRSGGSAGCSAGRTTCRSARAAVYAQGCDVYVAPDLGQLRRVGADAAPHRQGGAHARDRGDAVPARARTCATRSRGSTRSTAATTTGSAGATRRSSAPRATSWPGRWSARQGILYAELDLAGAPRRRAGCSTRSATTRVPDVFRLHVDARREAGRDVRGRRADGSVARGRSRRSRRIYIPAHPDRPSP